MNYRIANQNDIQQINELCDKNELEHPTLNICMVAEDNGKIVGYFNAIILPMVDTVCENPVASKTLCDRMNGYLLGRGYSNMIMFTRKESVEKVATKYGFEKIRNDVNVFLKGLF